jgi:hypothetical protein
MLPWGAYTIKRLNALKFILVAAMPRYEEIR